MDDILDDDIKHGSNHKNRTRVTITSNGRNTD